MNYGDYNYVPLAKVVLNGTAEFLVDWTNKNNHNTPDRYLLAKVAASDRLLWLKETVTMSTALNAINSWLVSNQMINGCVLICLLQTQRPEQSVMQALESLNDHQVSRISLQLVVN